MDYRHDIANLYYQILEEGIDEKIPKLLQLVRPDIEDKESYIRWAAETFDPSKNAAYITWILRMLKKGVIAGEEDAQKVQERLTQFEELKKKPQFPKDKRDINAYKTYGDLAETLDQFQGIKTKGELKREAQEEGIQFMGSSGGREGAGISLYIVTSDEAGAKHFRNTDWCVKDPRYFINYGAPYYFFTKDGQPKTLLHLNSNQCMDVRDRPTDLDSDEQELMETEEMTNYVMENDNSDAALAFYSEKVGGGYDGQIHAIFWGKLEELISKANNNLKMFNIGEPYSEELEYYRPEAWGSIPYDMSPYEDYVGDRDFLKEVASVLSDCNIYVSDDWLYNDRQISDELDKINLDMTYDGDGYRNESITGKLESFIGELEGIERRFDPEEFDEKFKERMLKAGYLHSGWGDFINKVSIDSLKFDNFNKQNYTNTFIFMTNPVMVGEKPFDYGISFDIVDVDKLLINYKRQHHPYVLLAEFLKPFIQRGLRVGVNKGANTLQFSYEPKYSEDTTGKQYIKGLKAVKDFDTHFNFYINQIKKFMNKFVYPFLRHAENDPDHSYGIPENIKLPLLQIKSRKESEAQGMLDLHEKRTFTQFFNKRYAKIS
jgi:hypothetical protein